MRYQIPLAAFPLMGLTAATAISSTNCSASAFQKIIDANGTEARVQWATYVPEGGSLNPMNYTSASEYPTGLPESCAVQVNVASEGNSSYLVGVIFPYNWNGRMLYALPNISLLNHHHFTDTPQLRSSRRRHQLG